jgi:hypothetical protein
MIKWTGPFPYLTCWRAGRNLLQARGPEREAFLNQACAGDQPLRAKLEALPQAHKSPDPFLDPQAPPPANTTVLLHPNEGPGTLIGRCELLEKIGEGGFGVVYVAEQREAVKRRVSACAPYLIAITVEP